MLNIYVWYMNFLIAKYIFEMYIDYMKDIWKLNDRI